MFLCWDHPLIHVANSISRLPEHHYSYLQEQMDKGAIYYARDFPYSFDFLLENLADMAHIPIAHNAILGKHVISFKRKYRLVYAVC